MDSNRREVIDDLTIEEREKILNSMENYNFIVDERGCYVDTLLIMSNRIIRISHIKDDLLRRSLENKFKREWWNLSYSLGA
jgi:hypothetical protein